MQLQGKAAIITGAASGIGKAVSQTFAGEGCRMILADVNGPGLSEALKEIRSLSPESASSVTDVSQADQAQQLAAEALSRFGRIDILCNIAGKIAFGDVLSTSSDEWDAVMNTNAKGVFLCSKAALPHMIRQGRGVIVNMASTWGMVGGNGVASYCASKGAIIALTRSMAVDYADHGIRVNAVCPGAVDTPLARGFMEQNPYMSSEESLERIAQVHLLGRMGTAEELARCVLFLASDQSSFMTGSCLIADGGLTAQ